MRIIIIIAWNTFREWMREKFFMISAAICMFLMGLSIILGQMTFAEEQKIMTDFGLAAIELSGVFVAILSGAFLISREIEKQTCLLLLARPLQRSQFILGKWFGLFELTLFLFASSGIFLWLLIYSYSSFQNYIIILFSSFFKIITVLSLVVLISLIFRPLIAMIVATGVYMMGHWLDDLSFFAKKSENPGYRWLAENLGYIIPQYYRYNWKSFYFLDTGISIKNVTSMSLHYLCWIMIYLFFSILIFRRKDIV